jgi:endonuclease/exonuclease/phosphatase family metal-dependent hydrolase
MPPDGRRVAALAAVALTTLMGVHAMRGFLAMIVWNVGADRPALVLGGIAFAVYAAGLAGWGIGAGGRPRPGERRAAVLAALYVLSHGVRHSFLTPLFALALIAGWLWALPALIRRLGDGDAAEVIAPGVLTGFAAAAAVQTALHGLDPAMLRGVLPGLGAAAIAAALLASWRAIALGRPREGAGRFGLPGWGLIALGPYLMLQLTLLSNLGQVQALGNEGLSAAMLAVITGCAAGAVAMALPAVFAVRALAAAVSIGFVLPGMLEARGAALLPFAQVALSVTLAAALLPAAGGRGRSTALGGAAGLLVMFILMFAYYSRYEWPALWPVLAALVALPALRRIPPQRSAVSLAAAVAAMAFGVAGAVAGAVPSRQAAQPAPLRADLRLLDYNIHMGFDASGLPDPQSIAAAIAAAGADVIALQEVGRGWTVNGGADLFAWLRWRFPEYTAVYGPMNGALWGNAILVRHPVSGQGSVRFPLRESPFQRGLTWVTLPAPPGELLIVATHFAHEDTADADRLEQAGDLLAFWRGRPRTIVMGDFNAVPGSAPITRLEASGLRDALAPFGLASAPTYPSPAPRERIDYVFLSGDLEPVAASIPRTTASDHLPVVVRIRLR